MSQHIINSYNNGKSNLIFAFINRKYTITEIGNNVMKQVIYPVRAIALKEYNKKERQYKRISI